MTDFNASTPAAAPIHAKTTIISKFKTWLSSRVIRNRTFRELSNLSEHELRDIGISRCDIGRIADETAGLARPDH